MLINRKKIITNIKKNTIHSIFSKKLKFLYFLKKFKLLKKINKN